MTNWRTDRSIFCCLGVLVLAGPAGADEITYTTTASWSSGNFLYSASASGSTTLPQFSPTLGTLQGVTLHVSTQYTTQALSYATGGTYIPPYYYSAWNWNAYLYSSVSAIGLQASATDSPSRSSTVTFPTSSLYAYVSIPQTTINGSSSLSASTSSLASYVGTGTVPVSVQVGEQAWVPPFNPNNYPAGFSWQLATITSAAMEADTFNSYSITYDYTPTPEPAHVLAAAAAAGAALHVFNRFRRGRRVS